METSASGLAWVQGSPTQELPPSALASPFPEMPTAALPPFWCSVVDLRRLGRWLRPLGAAPTPVLGAATAADPAAGVELGPSAAAAAAPFSLLFGHVGRESCLWCLEERNVVVHAADKTFRVPTI